MIYHSSMSEKKDDKENNHFEGLRLNGLYEDIQRGELYDFASFEIEIFESYLDAMIIKVHKRYNGNNGFTDKTPEGEENIERLQWMKRNIHRQKYFNRIMKMQASVIDSMRVDLRLLESKNIAQLKEIETLKETLKQMSIDGKIDVDLDK